MKIEKVEGLFVPSDLVGTDFVVRITTEDGTPTGRWPRGNKPSRTDSVFDNPNKTMISSNGMPISHRDKDRIVTARTAPGTGNARASRR